MTTPDTRPRNLHALTSLRFGAALLVVFFHDGLHLFAGSPGWIQNIVRGGYVGVPFFFILSGFILAYNYLPRDRQVKRATFWKARFARVYPVYLFSLVVSAPLFWMALKTDGTTGQAWAGLAWHAVTHGLMIQAWHPEWSFLWNGPAWSLSVEAFFYFLFPFLIVRQWKRKAMGWLVVLGMAAGLLILVGRLVPAWNLLPTLKQFLGWANPLLWLPLFLLGMLAGETFLKRQSGEAGARFPWSQWRPGTRSGVSLILAGLVLLAMALDLQQYSMLLFCYLVALPCALLLLFVADPAHAVSRALSWRPLVRLGEASYALYILHRPIHEVFLFLESRWGWPSPESTVGFWIYLATALLASLGVWRCVEIPCRRWLRGKPQTARQPVDGRDKPGQQALPLPV